MKRRSFLSTVVACLSVPFGGLVTSKNGIVDNPSCEQLHDLIVEADKSIQLNIAWECSFLSDCGTLVEQYHIDDKNGWPLVFFDSSGYWGVMSLDYKKAFRGKEKGLIESKRAALNCCCEQKIQVLALIT